MATPTILLPSKSAINKCGSRLVRVVFDDDNSMTAQEIDEAIRVITDFRAAHAYPMQKVRYGLRSMIRTENARELLSQRLKRVPRIVRKLHRMGNSRLSSLEDIGGCRAVVTNGAELDRVRARMKHNWRGDISRERDYVDLPKKMGYRAYHATVQRDGRAIEVQLRTFGQQQWAEAVEAADARNGLNLKDEDGPESMIEYFRLAAEVIHAREYGIPIDNAVIDEFQAARQAVIAEGYYRA